MAIDEGPGWLFVPADRPDRYPKALDRADVVVIDLEDAVAQDGKANAREMLQTVPFDPARTVVRVNGATTPHLSADLEALASTACARVMLPMAEDRAHLEQLTDYDVVALVETAAGVRASGDLASVDHVVGLMFGAEDLVESLGGRASRTSDGVYDGAMAHAWSEILYSARAAGKFALDSVWVDIPNIAGLTAEAERASAAGYAGKTAIHPSHIPAIRRAFAPSDEQIEWARHVVDLAADAEGVFTFDGQMIDEPLVAQATRILRNHSQSDG